MTTTQHVVATRAGGPEVLALVDAPMPVPGPGEMLVEMEAAGVAYADLMVREGRYPGVSVPVVPGYDVVGRVVSVGDGVGRKSGDRVGALTVTGSYARHRIVRAADAVAMPDGDAAELTSLILNGVTAWQLLTRCVALNAGDTVVVHGAAGGVGTLLLQLCAARGITAIGTASAGKRTEVERWGGRFVDHAEQDFVAAARTATAGPGADAVFDHVGGAHVRRSYEALRAGGTVVSYGAMDVATNGRVKLAKAARLMAGQPRFTPMELMAANKAVVGYTITGRRDSRPDQFAGDLAQLLALHADGTLRPPVAVRLPLSQAAEAHRMLGERRVTGKIVLTP